MKRCTCLLAACVLLVSAVLCSCDGLNSKSFTDELFGNQAFMELAADDTEETVEPSAEEAKAEGSGTLWGQKEDTTAEATRTTLNHGESSTKVSYEETTEAVTEAFVEDEEYAAEFQKFCNSFIVETYSGYTMGIHMTFKDPEAVGFEEEEPGWVQFSMDDDWYEASEEDLSGWLNRLHEFDKSMLSEKNQITYESFERYLTIELDALDYSFLYEPLAATNGYQTQLPVLLATYSFYTEKDVEDYLAILNIMPEHFEDLLLYEHQKSEAGNMMEDQYIEQVQETCRDFAATKDECILLGSFETSLESLDLTDEQKEAYIERNTEAVAKVCEAYELLADGLEELKGTGQYEGGLANYPNGKEYYAYLLKSGIGTSMTPEECMDFVEAALEEDMTAYYRIYMKDFSIFDKIENIKVISDPEEIMKDLIEKTKSDFPSIGDVEYTINYLDEAFRETMSPACYITPPNDAEDINNIFINADPGEEVDDLYVTIAHEGYPGHLYETNYHKGNTDYLTTFLSPTGYSEGWAEYVECMSYTYIDGYTEAMARISGLNSRLMVELCCIAELGIHYEGWTLSDMVDYLGQYLSVDEENGKELYDYIVTNPQGYTTYCIGMLEIDNIKDEYERKAGKKFTLYNFHEDFLNVGPTAFEIIRRHLFD